MAVPEEIRKVPRPVNTVVVDNGSVGVRRYAVRERAKSVCKPGHNPSPRNGKTIGHIFDGKFIPLKDELDGKSDMLSYGTSALVKSVTEDLLSELLDIYSIKDAYTIMVIASLRVIKPSVSGRRLSTEYNRTFISQYYPEIPLTQNTVSNFLEKLGRDGEKRRQFYQKRTEAVIAEHHIAIDGTLKQDSSKINDLSAFSYKARVKGCKDVSVLYAYDIEEMEPICAEVFPGNSIDAISYAEFIRNNDIQKGIIVADKGFPPSKIKEELGERPDLHFLTPIKKNDTRIKNNDMLKFEGVLTGIPEEVEYKKACIKGGRFLYAFKDHWQAALEESTYLKKLKRPKIQYDQEKVESKRSLYGVIVFESDLDLPPKTAYICYAERWLLELVFKHYKSAEKLDRTNVQGDFSVIGSEFINFISTIATCRISRKAAKAGLLDEMSYGDLLDDLSSAWRYIDAPEPPKSDDKRWVHTLPKVFKELEALGLSEQSPHDAPKKRGRPKTKPDVNGPKRPRGRPRKNPLPS